MQAAECGRKKYALFTRRSESIYVRVCVCVYACANVQLTTDQMPCAKSFTIHRLSIRAENVNKSNNWIGYNPLRPHNKNGCAECILLCSVCCEKQNVFYIAHYYYCYRFPGLLRAQYIFYSKLCGNILCKCINWEDWRDWNELIRTVYRLMV